MGRCPVNVYYAYVYCRIYNRVFDNIYPGKELAV